MQGEERLGAVRLPVSASADPAVEDRRRQYPKSSRLPEPELLPEEADSLREYLSVLGRHKLLVIISVLAAVLAALAYSSTQEPLYQASAAVLVNQGGAGGVLSDIPGLASTNDPERLAATHVSLARLPLVASRTITAAGLDEDPLTFLGRSSVSADADADILRFTVDHPDADAAAQLATTYAQQFTRYRNGLDLDAIRATRATITRTLSRLTEQGRDRSALYNQLTSAVRRLDAAEAVQGSAAVVIQPATSATQVQPRMKRNLALGLALGLIYGVGFAFLIERLGTRVRTRDEVEALVGLPSLGELSKPPNLAKHRCRVSMVHFPQGAYAESVRTLRTNLEFASLDVEPRSLMVTSGVQGEGKTTVAADLAVAYARSGKRVALCDLDARAPGLDRALGLDGRRGLVDVVLGHESLDRVLVSISWAGNPGEESSVTLAAASDERTAARTFGADVGRGSAIEEKITVLPFGSRRPHNPGDFVGSSAVRQVVEQLAATHDIVIVDTAPLLAVSDARAISEYVDAVLIVCSLKASRKSNLRSVRRLASVLPTRVFGVAITGVPAMPVYGSYGAREVE